MADVLPSELWQWGEYSCPWTYIAVVRLRRAMPSLAGRVSLRLRAFPLELIDGFAAPRAVLQQEWWLAAIQEPEAAFAAHSGDHWPTTTMPAFEAAWCAARQGDDAFAEVDLRLRRAFFAEGRDIGSRDVMHEIAGEAGLDLSAFARDFASGMAVPSIVEEARIGREEFRVRGVPTLMLATGKKIRHPLAYPRMENDIITGVSRLTCAGDGCIEATRANIEAALAG